MNRYTTIVIALAVTGCASHSSVNDIQITNAKPLAKRVLAIEEVSTSIDTTVTLFTFIDQYDQKCTQSISNTITAKNAPVIETACRPYKQ